MLQKTKIGHLKLYKFCKKIFKAKTLNLSI